MPEAAGMSPVDCQPPAPLVELDSNFNSDSNSDTQTDVDHLYTFDLRVFWRTTNTYGCPANDIKDHVLGMDRSDSLREDNMKKWSRHHVLARNKGWM
jgi:hypothetical protein